MCVSVYGKIIYANLSSIKNNWGTGSSVSFPIWNVKTVGGVKTVRNFHRIFMLLDDTTESSCCV